LISLCSPANLSPGIVRGFFLEQDMAKKAVTPIRPHSDQKDVAAFINRAFDSGDLDDICKAIGTAAKMHNITDIAKKSGIKRVSVYRAFAGGGSYPNLTTVAKVLDAMGLRLKVTIKRGSRAKPSRLARLEIRS
jgi:probable addiction module antidote protein